MPLRRDNHRNTVTPIVTLVRIPTAPAPAMSKGFEDTSSAAAGSAPSG